MLCERCKIREANIQYTEVVGGVKTEHNFCAQCAKELDFGPYSAIFDSDFPLGKLLSGLLGLAGAGGKAEESTPQIVCPTCKTTYEDFVKNSRFGCLDCYGVFDLLISDNIKKMQGSDTHKGKRPAGEAKIRAVPFTVRRQKAPSPDTAQDGSVSIQPPFDSSINEGEDGAAFSGIQQSPVDLEEEIQILEARLKDALKREDYETAAKCRDQIRTLTPAN